MPPKVRDLIAEIEKAGFVNRGGKGSHRNFVHRSSGRSIVVSGGLGDDAKPYQVKAVKAAVLEIRSRR